MHKRQMIDFPEYWEEVTPQEWAYLLLMREKLVTLPGVTLQDIKRAWCFFVLRRRANMAKGLQLMLLVDQLAESLDWMFRVHPEDNTIELTFETTVNLLPVWRDFVGPASHGADLTFGEFRHAVTAYNRYTEDHQPEDLLALCAILYRRRVKNKGAWLRQPYNPDRLDKNMAALRKMPAYLQWGVYAWFGYFNRYLMSEEFIIDGSQVSFAPLFAHQAAAGPAHQNIGLNAIRFSVAESGVFGNSEETDNTSLLQVMLKLLDDHQRAEDLLSRTKTN